MKTIKILIIVLLTSFSYTCKSQIIIQDQVNYSTNILGNWISNDDNQWKLTFLNNGIRKDYYANELQETVTYTIQSNSCENESSVGLTYLKTVDSNNHIKCFEILSVNYEGNNKLSLMDIDRGKILIFTKQ